MRMTLVISGKQPPKQPNADKREYKVRQKNTSNCYEENKQQQYSSLQKYLLPLGGLSCLSEKKK